jgi:hypothetical protein
MSMQSLESSMAEISGALAQIALDALRCCVDGPAALYLTPVTAEDAVILD